LTCSHCQAPIYSIGPGAGPERVAWITLRNLTSYALDGSMYVRGRCAVCRVRIEVQDPQLWLTQIMAETLARRPTAQVVVVEVVSMR
jgi:hypothetical protein